MFFPFLWYAVTEGFVFFSSSGRLLLVKSCKSISDWAHWDRNEIFSWLRRAYAPSIMGFSQSVGTSRQAALTSCPTIWDSHFWDMRCRSSSFSFRDASASTLNFWKLASYASRNSAKLSSCSLVVAGSMVKLETSETWRPHENTHVTWS